MDCEGAEPRMLELVEGVLDAAMAAEVRAHAAACDACGRSLTRLETGRAFAGHLATFDAPAPSAAVEEALARHRVRCTETVPAEPSVPPPHAEQPAVPAPRSRPPRSDLEIALRRLGTLAMRPQVAMATLLVLMIGIGLWSVPALRGRTSAGGYPTLEHDASDTATAGGLRPAEPLAFDFDPRTRRLAPVGTSDRATNATPRSDRRTTGARRPADDTTSSEPPADPAALHAAARDAAARGALGECVRRYDALLGRASGYADVGPALLELAACQRQLGRTTAARRSLERALQFPPVRDAAARELDALRVPAEEPTAAPAAPAANDALAEPSSGSDEGIAPTSDTE